MSYVQINQRSFKFISLCGGLTSMAQGESMRVTITHEEEISRHYMVTSSLSMHCQKSRPNTLGQQGTPISSVTLARNLQLLYWQGQGQNQEL